MNYCFHAQSFRYFARFVKVVYSPPSNLQKEGPFIPRRRSAEAFWADLVRCAGRAKAEGHSGSTKRQAKMVSLIRESNLFALYYLRGIASNGFLLSLLWVGTTQPILLCGRAPPVSIIVEQGRSRRLGTMSFSR